MLVGEVDEAAGQAVVEEIQAAGGTAALAAGDCSDVTVADAVVRQAVEQFGHLDALVNNAGILRDRTLVKMTPEEWDAVIAVHLRGHYAPTHAACGYWKSEGRPGHIVCTASTSGLLGNFGQTNYGAAKAGIAAFSTIVAQEMARSGVTCNAIAPAARTRMTEGAYGEIAGEAVGLRLLAPGQRRPVRRLPVQRRGLAHLAARSSACRATPSSSTGRSRRWP